MSPSGPPKRRSAQNNQRGNARRAKSPGRGPVVRPAVLSSGEDGMRLQKFMATAGVDSRRKCEELIRAGRVTIDGEVVSNPAVSVQVEDQDIRLDGDRLRIPRYQYFIVNKPKGVVCTNSDPAGRPRAIDLVPSGDRRLFTVGRLDENTEGLLLVTNDGALAEHMAHPRYEVPRRYRVQVAGIPSPETLTELRKGMYFSDGFFKFQSIRLMKRKGRSAFLDLELREGKNREIRRLLARAGHKVMHLERVAFGPLRIGRLELGACRELRAPELRELYDFISNPIDTRPAPRKPRAKTRKPGAGKKKSATKKKFQEPAKKSRRGAARHSPAEGAAPRKSVKKSRAKGRKRGK